MAAERLHGDDTTVPVMAPGKCDIARWVYVKDDRPFGGSDPPAAMFYYSRSRKGEQGQEEIALLISAPSNTWRARTLAPDRPRSHACEYVFTCSGSPEEPYSVASTPRPMGGRA